MGTMSRHGYRETFYIRLRFVPFSIRIPRRLAIRLYSRARARVMLADEVLAFWVCEKPGCEECAEIARHNAHCGYGS